MFGTILYTVFQYEAARALAQPVEAKVEVFVDGVPGLPNGSHSWPAVADGRPGACRMRFPWSMHLPVASANVPPAARAELKAAANPT